jgi:hypothetical protein
MNFQPGINKRIYFWGLAGVVPNLGLIVGLILFYKGIFTYRDKKLIFIAIGCIVFTPLFWIIIMHTSAFDASYIKAARSNVNSTIANIEFYKSKNGAYPDSLEQLRNTDDLIPYFDPMIGPFSSDKKHLLHYNKIRDKYTLFSIGLDKVANKDDIYPTITNGDTIKFGFVKK